jgi:hypothetical protein
MMLVTEERAVIDPRNHPRWHQWCQQFGRG